MARAHRMVWIEANGPIPDGLVIRHKCDNPSCVNLDHLEIGTQSDNVHDMIERGRMHDFHGEANPRALLSLEDVMYIRSSLESQKSMAAKYGVSKSTISAVVTRKNWSDIA